MEKFKQLLVDKGIKPTYQRIKILEYLETHENHPTVEMIYKALYKKVPTLSRTTVYNTLDIFREHGLVALLSTTDSEARYEYNFDSHHHFICKECGAIIDIPVKCSFRMVLEREGHRVDEVHGNFIGICSKCLAKKK